MSRTCPDTDTFVNLSTFGSLTGGSNAATNFAGGNVSGNMGIGLIGDAQTLFKRKFRFLFGIEFCNGTKRVTPSFVKLASRPDITVEETELNFLNEKTWIPGKGAWETITVTYLDPAGNPNISLYDWLATIYDFTSECRTQASKPIDYAGTAHLVLLDGCGGILEKWTLGNMWPTSIKFGELDYSSSDITEIELTLRYSQVQYDNSFCGRQVEPCACSPCGLSQ